MITSLWSFRIDGSSLCDTLFYLKATPEGLTENKKYSVLVTLYVDGVNKVFGCQNLFIYTNQKVINLSNDLEDYYEAYTLFVNPESLDDFTIWFYDF